MASFKFFRIGSLALVLVTFIFGSNKDQPDLLNDLVLYNAVPLGLLALSFFALKGEDLRTRVSFELALFFWFAGSVISSLTQLSKANVLMPKVITSVNMYQSLRIYQLLRFTNLGFI